MNDMTVTRTPEIIAAEINSIKLQTRNIVLFNSIEIGKRLTEAKAMLEHGQFGPWLKSVEFTSSTANNLMRIYEEYGADQGALFCDNAKSQAVGKLSYTQAVMLLGVPGEEREAFIEKNNASELSVRALQAKIKEYEKEKQLAADKNKKLSEAKTEAETKAQKLSCDLVMAKNSKEEAEEAAKKARDDIQKLKDKIKEYQEELSRPVTIEQQIVERIPEDILQELEQLRKAASDSKDAECEIRFRIVFTSLQENFNELLNIMNTFTDEDKKSKYKSAAEKLLNKMFELV